MSIDWVYDWGYFWIFKIANSCSNGFRGGGRDIRDFFRIQISQATIGEEK